MKLNEKYNENVGVLDMLLKTEQFLSLKDEIVKDSFKAILSILKFQNDKINKIDVNLYDKVSREEFNQNIKLKVNYSDFMSQLNDLGGKEKNIENLETYPSTLKTRPNENNFNLENLNKDLQNLKIEFSIFSKKIENLMLLYSDDSAKNISVEGDNKFLIEIKNKLDKNEKDITDLTLEIQNKFIKYDDLISNIQMGQINKNELNQDINNGLRKIDENNLKYIENEFSKIKNNINKQITDTIIEINSNNINSNNNYESNKNIKIDLMLKEMLSKFNIYDDILKEMNAKFHKKIDKEEIINIYSNIEEIKNDINNHRTEVDIKINELLTNYKIEFNKKVNIDNDSNISYFEKEIKNIKFNMNEKFNEISKLKEEIIEFKKRINNFELNDNENEIRPNNIENIYNFNNNIYPKNDFKNEVAYLKRFMNMFMLEIKNENKKTNDTLFNTLKDKINIIDINRLLKDINIDMNNKVNLDIFNKKMEIQNNINNYICKEHIIGKWLSHKNTPLNNAFILWDEQLINLAPNNYSFTPNNSQIILKEKGIYLIKIIIFNNFNINNPISNIQLVIDRKKIYNYSFLKNNLIINDEISKNNNFFDKSIIYEECIQVDDICRVEVRIDGFNDIENKEIILGNKEMIAYKNEKIKAILNIISL